MIKEEEGNELNNISYKYIQIQYHMKPGWHWNCQFGIRIFFKQDDVSR